MAELNLDALSVRELQQLIKDAERKAGQKQEEKRKELLARFKEEAAEEGLTLEEIIGSERGKKPRRETVAEPKYQNPNDPEQTWTGKGPKPSWVREALAAGKKKEDLRIR